MLNLVRLRNFRGIEDSGALRLAPLNVLVGGNGTGKSSFLYALLLLRQTFADKDPRTPLVTALPGMDPWGFSDLATKGSAETGVGIEFGVLRKALPASLLCPAGSFAVEFAFDRETNQILVSRSSVYDEARKVLLRVARSEARRTVVGIPSELKPHLRSSLVHFVPTCMLHGRVPRDSKLADRVVDFFLYSQQYPVVAGQALGSISYIGPVRERIPRYAVRGTQTLTEVGPSGSDLLRVLTSKQKVGDTGRTALQLAQSALKRHFSLLKRIAVVDVDKEKTLTALLTDEPGGGARNINAAFSSMGFAQVLPIIVQTVRLPKGGCLLVEQPELHLHPAAQADLADLFIDNLADHRQYLIETHSEHLVLRLRRRIAEGKLDPKNVAFFYFERDGGRTNIRRIDVDAQGMVPGWPDGFFEQGYEETMKIAEASLRGRKK